MDDRKYNVRVRIQFVLQYLYSNSNSIEIVNRICIRFETEYSVFENIHEYLVQRDVIGNIHEYFGFNSIFGI